jgi:hypothetical protein
LRRFLACLVYCRGGAGFAAVPGLLGLLQGRARFAAVSGLLGLLQGRARFVAVPCLFGLLQGSSWMVTWGELHLLCEKPAMSRRLSRSYFKNSSPAKGRWLGLPSRRGSFWAGFCSINIMPRLCLGRIAQTKLLFVSALKPNQCTQIPFYFQSGSRVFP